MSVSLLAACIHILSVYDNYPDGAIVYKKDIAVAIEDLRSALQEELWTWL